MLTRRDLEEFKQLDTQYTRLKEEIPKYSYLTSLSETLIFTTYQAVLLADSEAPFPSDFTQESRDTYYRLKFRALSTALSSSVVAA
jgi:hypothetical protein